jgi:hypothetical protein
MGKSSSGKSFHERGANTSRAVTGNTCLGPPCQHINGARSGNAVQWARSFQLCALRLVPKVPGTPRLVDPAAAHVGGFSNLYIFRRKQRSAEQLRFREDLRAGRVQRISLATRCAVMLASLGLVVTGSLVEDGTIFLMLGGPVLFLFAVEEFNIIMRPGDSVLTNPRDELLAFFKARSLQLGYSIAILSLAVLCLVGLFATRYVGVLLPVALTVSLLAPSLLYSRLDRRAGAAE